MSGSSSPPTLVSPFTSGGQVSKLLTATTCGPAPIANSISVTAGTIETMRCGGPADGRSRADGAAPGAQAASTTANAMHNRAEDGRARYVICVSRGG